MRFFRNVALLIVISSCVRAGAGPPAPAGGLGYQRTIVDRSRPERFAADVDIPNARAVLAATYRIRPDRRFVNAAADIEEIVTGKHRDAVEIDFVKEQWQVSLAGHPALRLDQESTFSAALAGLTKWAASKGEEASSAPASPQLLAVADRDIEQFYPRHLYSALHRLDTAKTDRPDGPLLVRSARAAALLAMQAPAAFDLAAPLQGRALALLALARAADPSCCAEESTILASVLGYETEANQMAAALPAGSVAAAFVKGHGSAALPTSNAKEWLALREALRETPLEVCSDRQLFKGAFDSESVSPLLEDDKSGCYYETGAVVEALVNDALRGRTRSVVVNGTDDWATQAVGRMPRPAEALKTFEALLPQRAHGLATRFVDERAVRSFYEAELMAALSQQFKQWFDQQASESATNEFVASLAPASPTARQVVRWMQLMSAANWAHKGVRPREALQSIALLGGTARQRLFSAEMRMLGSTDSDIRSAARELLMSVDSRPQEMWAASVVSDVPIGHLEHRDRYAALALARAGGSLPGGAAATHLYYTGDQAGLRRIADDRSAAIDDRAVALSSLSVMGDELLYDRMENVIADSHYDPSYLIMYSGYADRHHRPDLKEAFARRVLANNPGADNIPRAWIVSNIASAMEAQGRYAAAWRLVEPEIEVSSADILATAVSLLQRRGQGDEAVALGRQMVARYPEVATRADFACVLWRMHRYEDAAALFDPAAAPVALDDFDRFVPKAFVETFRDVELRNAMRAYDALIAGKLSSHMLESFGSGALEAKRYRLAVALDERFLSLPAAGADSMVQMKAWATGYRAMKELEGTDAAMQWFLGRMTAAPSFEFMHVLFNERQYELLSAIASRGVPAGDRPVEQTALIAASLALQRVPLSDPRWSIVRTVFTTRTPAPDQVIEFAAMRYILGLGGAEDVIRPANNPNDRCTASFFIGVKAVADGRMNDALYSFLADGEGAVGQYPPCTWGVGQLYALRGEMKSWAELAGSEALTPNNAPMRD